MIWHVRELSLCAALLDGGKPCKRKVASFVEEGFAGSR
jgi:hypothetical protein